MMGLAHGVHGIGDTVAISVHAAESAVGDVDAYVARSTQRCHYEWHVRPRHVVLIHGTWGNGIRWVTPQLVCDSGRVYCELALPLPGPGRGRQGRLLGIRTPVLLGERDRLVNFRVARATGRATRTGPTSRSPGQTTWCSTEPRCPSRWPALTSGWHATRSSRPNPVHAARTRSSLFGHGISQARHARRRLRRVEQGHPLREDPPDGPALGGGRLRHARRHAPVLRRQDPALHPRRLAVRAGHQGRRRLHRMWRSGGPNRSCSRRSCSTPCCSRSSASAADSAR